MLIRTLFIVLLLATLGAAIVHSTASLARAEVHRRANIAADTAFNAAVVVVQASAVSAIAGGADPRALPTLIPAVAPTCAVATTESTGVPNNGAACALTTTTTIVPTTTQEIGISPEGSGGGSGSACAPLCAMNAQENDAIAEGRLAVHITVAVNGGSGGSAGGGEIFASRDRYAIFRTIRIPPYVTLAGTRDATADAIAGGTSEGDDTGTPSLTTISVRYVNASTGAGVDANAWQSRSWNNLDTSGTTWDP
jgi:hypothetical protein